MYSSSQTNLPHRYGKLTCHMGSHSVTCHPTEVRIPPLPPTEAGTRFSDPGGMQGWVDLCYMKADRPGIEPWPVSCKSNALWLSHHATLTYPDRENEEVDMLAGLVNGQQMAAVSLWQRRMRHTTGITWVTPSPESMTVPVSVRSDACFDVHDAANASTAYKHTRTQVVLV